ncbi:MAG: methyltransferase domain-containing protein, partial [Euryarchaeota archaeon]|nr:methyltransferase domain-containing protein [Euryarchaeota archaeon]
MNAKSIIRSYWDWRSQTYGNTVYKSQDDAKQIWKTALNDAIRTDKTNKTDKKLNVLDVGTGTGFLALIFAEMGHKVTGVDISKHMLEK